MIKIPALLAIDPGGVHNGLAYFRDGECVWTTEMTPKELADLLEYGAGRGKSGAVYKRSRDVHIALELFRLYPWKAKDQSFSALEVVQTIGVIKYICMMHDLPLTEQPGTIKIPTAARAEARGYRFKSVADRSGGHAKDAELHGLHWLETNGYLTMTKAKNTKGGHSGTDKS